MTVEQAITNFGNKKNAIYNHYNNMLAKINDLKQQLDNLASTHVNNTTQWINDRKQILMNRIVQAQQYATQYLQKGLMIIQKELDKIKESIEAWIADKLEAILKAEI